VDWVIVTELLAVAVGYWLLALAGGGRFDSLLAANPCAWRLLARLGPRMLVVATAAAAFLVAGGCLMLASIARCMSMMACSGSAVRGAACSFWARSSSACWGCGRIAAGWRRLPRKR
jgi:hypothetical protein